MPDLKPDAALKQVGKKLDNGLALLQKIADRIEGLHSRLERIENKVK